MLRIIVICGLITLLSACNHRPRYTIIFEKVDGLKIGAPIMTHGFPIGEVTNIDLISAEEPQIAVDVKLTKDVNIPTGSKFILRKTLLGSTEITVQLSNSTQFMQPADTIAGIYTSPENTYGIKDSAQREKVRQSLKKINEGFRELLQTVRSDSTDSLRQH